MMIDAPRYDYDEKDNSKGVNMEELRDDEMDELIKNLENKAKV